MMRHHGSRGRPIQNSELRIQNGLPSAPTCNLELATCNLQPGTWNWRLRRSFTLTELLIVMMILSIMAGLALSAVSGAMELAREQRTRAIIAKLDQLIMERYEEYRTRAVPIRIPSQIGGTQVPPTFAAKIRLYALRDLMRMELPDRATDVIDFPATLTTSPVTMKLSNPPSLWQSYRRQAQRAMGNDWSTTWVGSKYESAECLYLIISTMHDGDKSALDFFLPAEIGDVDNNGMKEILDAWGTPIGFLRWAPGYTLQNGCLTTQTSEYTPRPVTDASGGTITVRDCLDPDPFDPLKVDSRWRITGSPTLACFGLRPLIFSAGRDKIWGIGAQFTDSLVRYSTMTIPNDPYYTGAASDQVGAPTSTGEWRDNFTNHYQETP